VRQVIRSPSSLASPPTYMTGIRRLGSHLVAQRPHRQPSGRRATSAWVRCPTGAQ
jgi:hypothetical protein